ncbi:MAG: hypothetical protein IPP17_24980 [Bacteroidetes bacterium]|nr:hypothetical protein [Bacteroidota bacterium]
MKADSFDLDFHQEIMESSEVPQYGGDMEIWGACPIDSGDFDDFMGGDDFGGEDFSFSGSAKFEAWPMELL